MFHIILFQPEIPPNTGNIIRLCANCGAQLHLIKPLGFELQDKKLRRAGLDYHEFANVGVYDNIEQCLKQQKIQRLFACSTRGTQRYCDPVFKAGDAFVFGPETRGLPQEYLQSLQPQQILRVPMLADSRSLNLSNTVAIIIFEAWRQLGFKGSLD